MRVLGGEPSANVLLPLPTLQDGAHGGVGLRRATSKLCDSDEQSDSDDAEEASAPKTKLRQGSDGRSSGRSSSSSFCLEIEALCSEGLEKPSDMQHKVLEMKSFRLASNATDGQVAAALVRPIGAALVRNAVVNQIKIETQIPFLASDLISRRVPYLFDAFMGNMTAAEYYEVYDEVARFCAEEHVDIGETPANDAEKTSSQRAVASVTPPSGAALPSSPPPACPSSSSSPPPSSAGASSSSSSSSASESPPSHVVVNPFFRSAACMSIFFEILNEVENETEQSIFDLEEHLPTWTHSRKQQQQQHKDAENYMARPQIQQAVQHPRFKAFLAWLQTEDADED
eukprot:GHVT01065862.1.p1 GENE.GHVT01065862.1~~GHVT01065862.1.p1  ORF type:complete len:342 (+),score=125.00 GHVT01065862.1:477-1502(+)